MKSYSDLKLRSKLPSRIQTEAKKRDYSAERESVINLTFRSFNVEQVDYSVLRFIWWKADPETSVKAITEVMEFEVAPDVAAAIMEKNNPEGSIAAYIARHGGWDDSKER